MGLVGLALGGGYPWSHIQGNQNMRPQFLEIHANEEGPWGSVKQHPSQWCRVLRTGAITRKHSFSKAERSGSRRDRKNSRTKRRNPGSNAQPIRSQSQPLPRHDPEPHDQESIPISNHQPLPKHRIPEDCHRYSDGSRPP